MKTYPASGLSSRFCFWLAVSALAFHSANAATYLWNVATPGPNNWNVNANWTPVGIPGAADTAVFGDIGTGLDQFTVNNVVSVSTPVSALLYTNLAAGTWHVTEIPASTTLTVTGSVTIGGSDPVTNLNTSAAMIGGGTLLVRGTNNLLTLGNNSSTGSAEVGTLDLSGLTTFIFEATNGFVGVGDTRTGGNGSRTSGNLTLAAGSNSITAATLDMNGATGTASQPTLNLVGDTNIINVNTFNVGGGRSTTKFQFTAGTGGLRLRGTGGADTNRTTMVVGNRNTGGTGTFLTSGSVLMNYHPVDMKLATLTLGLMSRNAAGSDKSSYQPQGIFEFDTGIVDATTINMGVCSGASTNAGATGTLTVGSTGTLLVQNISLANVGPSATNGVATGTLNINYGTVICSNNIVKTTVAGSTGILAVVGGTLRVGGSVGSSTNALDNLSLSDANLTLRADVSAPVNVTAMDTGGSTNVINISSVAPIFAFPAQFQVIKYTGTIGGIGFDNNVGLGTLPVVSPAYEGYLSNNTANASIDLVITNGPPPARALVWNGTPSADWDTATTTIAWLFSGSGTFYRQNDAVLFDDTAAGSTTVNLTTTLMPLSLAVSNVTKSYTFTGTGGLSGTPGLVKQGAGTLAIGNSGVNDFGGGVTVTAGKLQISGSADRLPTNAVVTLADDPTASLDLNGVNQRLSAVAGGGATGGNVSLGAGTLSIDGSGTYGGVISGGGSLVKSGSGTLTLLNANLYTGGTLVNTGTVVVVNSTGSGTGPGGVLIAGGTLQLGTNGTSGSIAPQAGGFITNNGTLRFNRSDTVTPAENITGGGSVRHSGSGLLVFNHDNSYTNTTIIDRNNGILRISTPNALGTVDGGTTVTGGNGAPVANGGALELSGDVVFAPERLTLGCRGTTTFGWVAGSPLVNHSGTNTWTGPIDITTGGSWTAIQSDAGLLRITGSISGGPTATATRFMAFRGAAFGEVSGVISNGPVTTALTVIVGDSGTWTLSAPNLYTGATVVTNTATLLVNGSIGGSSVSVVGGRLGGTGLISAPVTVNAGGTLAPGASIGTLTISNSLTLNGTTEMEVSHTGADKVAGLASVAFGGTLKIVIVGGLTGGEVFQLFEAVPGGYSGDFVTYDLPTLTAPLAWDTNSVPVDGTLRVTGGVQPPQIGGITRASDGNFQLTGTGPSTATYRVFATIDLALPLASWTQIGSGNFAGGTFTFTDLNATNYPRRFYSVVTP